MVDGVSRVPIEVQAEAAGVALSADSLSSVEPLVAQGDKLELRIIAGPNKVRVPDVHSPKQLRGYLIPTERIAAGNKVQVQPLSFQENTGPAADNLVYLAPSEVPQP